MKNKFNTPLFTFFAVLFIVLYIFLAAKPLSKEYQFNPTWKISTSNPTVSNTFNSKEYLNFHLGQSIGYFSSDGSISFYQTFPSKVSISNNYFSIYDSDSKNIDFFYNNGDKAGTFTSEGYPYFIDDLIYIFLPGGASFSKCNLDGSVKWTYEGTLPITAFSAKEKYTAVGFADGTIKIFNNVDGNTEINFEPGGSDYPIILGMDISEDGQYVGSISGHNKQRFVLSRREGNQQKIIYHTFLDEDLPYRTLVNFTKDSNRIIYCYKNAVGIYNIQKNKNTILPIKEKIISIKENNNFVYLLSQKKNNYTVYIVDKTSTLQGSFSFEAENAFIQTDDDNLYVGKDSFISCLSINKD